MLYYNRIDLNKQIDLNKNNNSKECMISNYCFLIIVSNVNIISLWFSLFVDAVRK